MTRTLRPDPARRPETPFANHQPFPGTTGPPDDSTKEMKCPFLIRACLALPLSLLAADAPPLLTEVADKMADERQHWAFTQLARESKGNGEVVERVERYDPSRGDAQRWQLLKLNGRPPTRQEAEEWNRRKNRTRGKAPKTLEDYADLSQARVRAEDAETVTYDIPLRSSAGGLFPGNKISLSLTVNKETKEIARAQAGIAEPFKIALGLAKVINLDLDLEMDDDGPEADKPQGSASAVVNKFGKRVEYHWSDFTRVTAPPAARQP